MHSGLLFNVVESTYVTRSLGIYRIAHYLREKNLDIEVIDYANYWSVEELKILFQSRYNSNLKFIGFSHLFSLWSDTLEEFCKWIKNNYPHIKIISGSSVNPMFESKFIDYYIQGYGEYAIEALLSYLISNGPIPKFNLLSAGRKKIIDAIHFYPAFPMKNLMVKYQDRDFIEPHEWLGVEFSRGCKFECSFCNFPILGVKGDYSRDSEDFKNQMLDTYDRFGVTNYFVADETFNDRTEKITKFADAVERLPFTPWFTGYIRADLLVARPMDREELLRMNFLGHYYGIETFNTDSGKSIGKGMDTDRLLTGLLEIKSFFKNSKSKQYRGTIGLIAGLPHDTFNSLSFTKQWLIDNWRDQSFQAYTLLIPTDSTTKSSIISSNYEKFGYKKMTNGSIKNKHLDLDIKLSKEILLWENSNMNIFEAEDFIKDLVKAKYSHNFYPTSFSLAHLVKGSLSIEDRLKLNVNEWQMLKCTKHITTYIYKKLSL